jgi:hypothetical protein
MSSKGQLTDKQKALAAALLAEAQRLRDTASWHAKLRLQLQSWRDDLFPARFTDREMVQYPRLAETQREWDSLPRSEKMRQQLDYSRRYGLINDLGNMWVRLVIVGLWALLFFLFVVAPIVKFLVPGGSEWLQQHVDEVVLACLLPLLLGVAGWLIAGWVALPFILALGLWRKLRG